MKTAITKPLKEGESDED